MSVGVVLGSGLGWFADTLENRTETPYSQIPGWPASTAKGHAGKLVTGRLGDTNVVVAAGRAHLYEGYTVQQVAYSIRELSWRGVTSLIVTNASGGINLNYKPGDFPNAEKIALQEISLPMFPELTPVQISQVSEAILDFQHAYSCQ